MATVREEFMTVPAAAKACGRNPETVRRWIWTGKLPAEKLGNQLFVRRSDLERYMKPDRDARRAAELAALQRAIAVSETICRETGGSLDIFSWLDDSRESHP